ncbi:FkbM family methyltransferase [Streptomyces cavernicola]|uniref:FkbM family methyltransferase n=1 Tax=Streptomyces cavernicola TaxID=3043613 RepID=A0ABT6SK41_9ACTN|nr:FkbM family methyltransferase [Streptomyces sp. B-S-A6]MDI3408274.1 FkbM family methyltransferase [Streptomyces sp. B-S-A6]
MTVAARIGPLLPARLVGGLAAAVYPRFEPELARLADFCPADCDTALDVGGWYGPWSRRLAGRARRVIAVEPVPHLARALDAATPANVRVVRAAATDRPGTARLWLPHDDRAARGDRGVSSLVRRDIHARALDVPCLPLDGLGLREEGRVDFVKIDVDGNELPVLRGAAELLDRDHPALLVELEARIQPTSPVVDLLAGHGYRGWVLPGRSWVPLDDFDLAAHQADTAHVVRRGLLRRVLPFKGPRYVNSVLFLAGGRRPGTAAVRDHGAHAR